MNSRERVLCALAGEQPDRVPFVESNIAQRVARAIAGSPTNLSESQISDLVHRDVVIASLYPPYFADQEWQDEQHFVKNGWIKTWDDLDKMVFPDPHDEALYANAREVLAQRGDRAAGAAIKHGVAPMMMSMGLDGFAFALADDPALVVEVLRRYVDWQLVVTQHLIEMGFDFLWTFDDVAYKSGPFCSPAAFRRVLMPAFRRSAEAITIPWIFHSDGNIMPLLNDLLTLGMSGIHPLEPGPMDLATVKEQYGKKVCLVGNVSVDTLSAGTPAEIREIVRNCMKIAGPGGGYMITSANSVPAYADPQNVKEMAEAIQEYGSYPIQL